MAKKGGGAVTQPFQSNMSGSSTSTMNPIAPTGYESAWNAFRPGENGLNPLQQTGVNAMQGTMPGLEWAGNRFQEQNLNRTAPTLRNLAAIDPTAYGAPASISPQTIEAQQIAARRGSEFMSDYQNPYMTDVVDASLASYDQGANEARNSLRAGNAGAFGNKRYGVAEGQFAADSALGRAQLGAGLRSDAFNTAANFGMADAGRTLAADQSNQQANLNASQMNAANALAASQFNNSLTNQRQMFDAGIGMDYNNQQDQLLRDYTNTQGAIAGLGGNLMNAGTTGQSQNLQWLGGGLPLFGQENTGNTTGNTSGYQTGVNQAGGKGGVLGGLGSLATGVSGFFPQQ